MFVSSTSFMRVFRTAIFAVAGVALAGCGASVPPYPGSGVAEPTNLTQVEFEKARISLAPGWEKDLSKVNNDTIVAGFTNGSASGYVQCMSSLMDAGTVGEVLREGMTGVSGNAKLVRGAFAVKGGLNKPYIEIHQGTMTSEGQEVPVTFYIGFNSFRYMGCNFGMTVIQRGPMDSVLEADFVAMFKTLN